MGRCTEKWGGKWDGGTLGEQILRLIPNFLGDFQAPEEQLMEGVGKSPIPQPSGRSSLTTQGGLEEPVGERWGFPGWGGAANGVLVSPVALQDLSLQGQGGGGRDGGTESAGGSADRPDHCQRVLAFLPAQGERSVPDHPRQLLPLRALHTPQNPRNSPGCGLSLCPQLPIPTGVLGVGKLPGAAGFGRFSTSLSGSNNFTSFGGFFFTVFPLFPQFFSS